MAARVHKKDMRKQNAETSPGTQQKNFGPFGGVKQARA